MIIFQISISTEFMLLKCRDFPKKQTVFVLMSNISLTFFVITICLWLSANRNIAIRKNENDWLVASNIFAGASQNMFESREWSFVFIGNLTPGVVAMSYEKYMSEDEVFMNIFKIYALFMER